MVNINEHGLEVIVDKMVVDVVVDLVLIKIMLLDLKDVKGLKETKQVIDLDRLRLHELANLIKD